MTSERRNSPSRPTALRVLIAALVVITVVQSRMNGELVLATGNAFEIGIVNILVGTLTVSVMIVARRSLRAAWSLMMTEVRSGRIRWWECLGGIGGTFFVTVQSASVPVLGVAVFTVAVVAGQTSNAAVVDRIGLGPAGRQPVNAVRVVAVILAVIAVMVSVSDRLDPSQLSDSHLAVIFAFLAVVAGGVSAFQSALNGRVAQKAGHGLAAGWMNFAVGMVIGAPIALIFSWASGHHLTPVPLDRPWLLLGGALGMLYVATVAWATRPLGVLLAAVLSVVGLLVGALVIDLIAPTAGTHFGWHLVLGVAVALCAAALAAAGRRWSR